MVVDAFSFTGIGDRFLDLLLAPVQYSEMLWIAIPLVLTLVLTELYFSRYKAEALGWNSAYGNALVLVFVAVDIFRYLYNHALLETMSLKLAVAIALTMLAIILTVCNFLHLLPENVAYGLSAKLPMNFLAYLALLLVYSEVPIDWLTLLAAAGLLIVFSAVIILLQMIIPSSVEEVEY